MKRGTLFRPQFARSSIAIPTQAELAAAGPDNIARLTAHMVDAGHVADAEVADLRKEVSAIVEDAVQFALQSPQPTMDAAWAHLTLQPPP